LPGRPDRPAVAGAEAKIANRRPIDPEIVGLNRADGGVIIRQTAGAGYGQFLEEGRILQDRKLNFAEEFFHRHRVRIENADHHGVRDAIQDQGVIIV